MNAEQIFPAPIIFFLENINATPRGLVRLFMSSRDRLTPNSGLPVGVSVTFAYSTNNYTYAQLLADIEDSPYSLWKFRIDFISGPDADSQMNQQLYEVTRLSDGTIIEKALAPYQDLDQTQPNAREFRYPVILDSDRGIRIDMDALTKVRFMIWMDKTVSLTNKLATGDSKFTFSKPFPLEAKMPYLVRIIYGQNCISFLE